MLNLLKKIQLIQFLIIIFFYILSSNSTDLNNKEIIDKSSDYYNYLLDIIYYNNVFNKGINNENSNIMKSIEKNDYIFYYKNDYNVSALFFKENNSSIHNIYFNGINNLKDIKLIIKIFSKNFTFKNIEKLLNKPGSLFTIINNNVEELESFRDKSVLDVYDFIHENIYMEFNKLNDKTEKKINIKINGYSFGGPLSQIFIYILYDKYGDILNIENYNIESWFAGSEEDFEDYKKIVKFYNIYNKKSVLNFYNNFFQKYFEYDYLIDTPSPTLENDIDPYIGKLFPNGIIKYVKDNHLLKKIIVK